MPDPFESAPPVKGAMIAVKSPMQEIPFQSAPPVKGAISLLYSITFAGAFQSAPPVKGAILRSNSFLCCSIVSIRAPREGGDLIFLPRRIWSSSFNPRPP